MQTIEFAYLRWYILDMQISKCNVISGYAMIDSSCGLIHAVIPLREE